MRKLLEEAVLKTLAYADIFNYPLKKEEIWQWLIVGSGIKKQELGTSIQDFHRAALISCRQGYYFLSGREKIAHLRQVREKWSQEKWQKAQKISRLLKIIPTVKMVAVTGNLAVKNCDKDDDIDLLIIASGGTLWLTRLLATFLLEVLGQRRHPGQTEIRNKICLNMFLDEDHLGVSSSEQDLYTAHEVVQLEPLWSRGQTYQNFLAQNLWVKNYLPNALRETKILGFKDIKRKRSLFSIFLSPLEKLSQWLQLKYMAHHRTSEVIRPGIIRFHPQDARGWILKEYQKRLQNLPP